MIKVYIYYGVLKKQMEPYLFDESLNPDSILDEFTNCDDSYTPLPGLYGVDNTYCDGDEGKLM